MEWRLMNCCWGGGGGEPGCWDGRYHPASGIGIWGWRGLQDTPFPACASWGFYLSNVNEKRPMGYTRYFPVQGYVMMVCDSPNHETPNLGSTQDGIFLHPETDGHLCSPSSQTHHEYGTPPFSPPQAGPVSLRQKGQRRERYVCILQEGREQQRGEVDVHFPDERVLAQK